jgi:hypothetical protein
VLVTIPLEGRLSSKPTGKDNEAWKDMKNGR